MSGLSDLPDKAVVAAALRTSFRNVGVFHHANFSTAPAKQSDASTAAGRMRIMQRGRRLLDEGRATREFIKRITKVDLVDESLQVARSLVVTGREVQP